MEKAAVFADRLPLQVPGQCPSQCGHLLPHPHIPEIYLRLHYVSGLDEGVSLEERSRMIVLNAINESKDVFRKVRAVLPK